MPCTKRLPQVTAKNVASTLQARVSDPHCFNADPDTDPDPAFFLIADPDSRSGSRIRIPDPEPGFDDLKLKKITAEKKINFFFDQKLQFTYP